MTIQDKLRQIGIHPEDKKCTKLPPEGALIEVFYKAYTGGIIETLCRAWVTSCGLRGPKDGLLVTLKTRYFYGTAENSFYSNTDNYEAICWREPHHQKWRI